MVEAAVLEKPRSLVVAEEVGKARAVVQPNLVARDDRGVARVACNAVGDLAQLVVILTLSEGSSIIGWLVVTPRILGIITRIA